MILALLISPISAAKGSLTFVHGVNKSKLLTYASINSTAIERPLGIEGLVYIYDGELDGGFIMYHMYTKQMLTTLELKLMLGAQKENRIFYYCDHILRHESTKWWYFDFR